MVPPKGPTRLTYVSISPQNTFLSIETLQNAGIGFTELFDSEKLYSLEQQKNYHHARFRWHSNS